MSPSYQCFGVLMSASQQMGRHTYRGCGGLSNDRCRDDTSQSTHEPKRMKKSGVVEMAALSRDLTFVEGAARNMVFSLGLMCRGHVTSLHSTSFQFRQKRMLVEMATVDDPSITFDREICTREPSMPPERHRGSSQR